MTNLGIHHVDTFQCLLGPIVRAMAFSRRVALTGVEIDDATSILFEFASRSLGYLGTSWVHANRTSVITLHGTEAQAGARRTARASSSPDAASRSGRLCPSHRRTRSSRSWLSSRGV